MKKALGLVWRIPLALIVWLGIGGTLAAFSLMATVVLLLLAIMVDGMALRLASLETMCGIYTGEMFTSCAASPWFRIATLLGLAGLIVGLYLGYQFVREILFPAPAETKPGEGDGKPHREADDSEDPRWRMLRMAAHIAWLRNRYPVTLAEHEAYLSIGDNAIIGDYTLIWTETWKRWLVRGTRPPCNHAPSHPGQAEP